ncbi:hypothetical protein [Pseudomonas urethralis]|uniref:hypothetical protein n=1 Tax=Pseudomonas urethralis TaxID=2740517 RepID=UPI001596FF82|nr:hypothetical protein [Pseudomonas urethralis]
MANTQVFTLGLGVTVINPLGLAIEQLRRDVERLRRQADGTRLGRLIGEVIRLGLELGKVRQVERQLALDQDQHQQDQIARLGTEADEVERLRQHYLSLDRVIAGLARLKPVFQQGQQHGAAPNTARDPAAEASAASSEKPSRTRRSTAESVKVAASVLGVGTIVGARMAYEVGRRLPAEQRQRAQTAISSRLKSGAFNAGISAFKAWIDGETPEDKAKGMGAAAGELGGTLLGASIAAVFTKNKEVQELAGVAGGHLGEWAGELLGGRLFDLVMYQDNPDRSVQGSSAATVVNAAPAVEGAGYRGESKAVEDVQALRATQVPSPPGAAVSGAFSLLASVATAGTPGQGFGFAAASPPLAPAGGSRPGAVRSLFRRVPVGALLDTSLQLAQTYRSDATAVQKVEGYGSAVGGLGGTLAGAAAGAAIGSVVPVIGTAIGGLLGGALGSIGGESLGGWFGKALGAGLGLENSPASKHPVSEPARSAAAQLPSSAPASAALPAPINQQFTFTANMPVTFSNSLDDPTTLQQLEAIARRVLDDLMRQARSVQMADQPQP